MMNFDTFSIAFIFALLGFGVFLSFKILSITDLTIEASYTLGGAICIMFCKEHLSFLALIAAFVGGMLTGGITALLHTKLKINAVLSGILTLTAFYSLNLMVTDHRPSIALKITDPYTIFYGMNSGIKCMTLALIIVIIGCLLALFFMTKLGLSIRACGDNELMAKTQCISTDNMKIIGLMLSNGLVALSGALFVQFQSAYSSDMGSGIMVVGVACIIIGEIFTFGKHNIPLMLVGIGIGSIVYRMIYSFALSLDFIQASDLKLISSLLLIVILGASTIKSSLKEKRRLKKRGFHA